MKQAPDHSFLSLTLSILSLSLLDWRDPELETVKCGFTSAELSPPFGHAAPKVSCHVFCVFCNKSTLLTHMFGIHCDPLVLFSGAAAQIVCPKAMMMPAATSSR